MSAVTASRTAPARATSPYRVTFGHLVKSEWIKFRTVRSTWWTAGITVVLMVLMTLAMSAALNSQISEGGMEENTAMVTVFGFIFAQMSVAVLGALTITGEYGTGMIRSTLAAAPTRLPALWAKTLVTMIATAVIAAIGLALSALVAVVVLGDNGPDFAATDTWRAVGMCVVYLMLIAVLSVSVGALVRHSAGAISILVGLLFIINMVLSFISLDWVQKIAWYTPTQLGQTLMIADSNPDAPSLTTALIALVLWAVLPLIGASFALKKRDA